MESKVRILLISRVFPSPNLLRYTRFGKVNIEIDFDEEAPVLPSADIEFDKNNSSVSSESDISAYITFVEVLFLKRFKA